ncbi:MAG: hypothetical protein HZA48_03485 [Planctomycetes bacterium]|nr:hypothetical protein [Planctomycetota bacterium]
MMIKRNTVTIALIIIVVSVIILGCSGADMNLPSQSAGKNIVVSEKTFKSDDLGWESLSRMEESPGWSSSAVLLSNGDILVCGGIKYPDALSSALIFEVDKNKWRKTASMHYPRGYHTGTLLPSGKILVTGGMNHYSTNVYPLDGGIAECEIFDPEKEIWEETAPMSEPRVGHQATLLKDGRVLVTGGSTAEIYDCKSMQWKKAGDLKYRAFHTSTLLNDGRVLIAGGLHQEKEVLRHISNRVDILSDVFSFDPIAEKWEKVASMNEKRCGHSAILLNDGRVLVSGGRINEISATSMVEIFDNIQKKWTRIESMKNSRSNHKSMLLPDGTVLVTGGDPIYPDRPLVSTEMLSFTAFNWVKGPDMKVRRTQFNLVQLEDGNAVAIGGWNGNYVTEVERIKLMK